MHTMLASATPGKPVVYCVAYMQDVIEARAVLLASEVSLRKAADLALNLAYTGKLASSTVLHPLAVRLAEDARQLPMLHLRRAVQALVMVQYAEPGTAHITTAVASSTAGTTKILHTEAPLPAISTEQPANAAAATVLQPPAVQPTVQPSRVQGEVAVYGALAAQAAALASLAPSAEAGSLGLAEGVARSFALALQQGLAHRCVTGHAQYRACAVQCLY